MRQKKVLVTILILIALAVMLAACNDGQTISGVAITAPPTKTTYIAGEIFNPDGLEVCVRYDDGKTEVIKDYTYAPRDALTVNDDKITVFYSVGGKTYSAYITINVTSPVESTLEKPQVTAEDNSVVWNSVNGAAYYEVYINDVKVSSVYDTSYSLELPAGAYTVCVVAVNGDKRSEMSDPVLCVIGENRLATPFVQIDGNKVFWQQISNAKSYEIFVNGMSAGETDQTETVLEYTEIGVYNIQIKAKNADSDIKESQLSNTVKFVVSVDTSQPLVLVDKKGNLISEGNEGFMVSEKSYDGSATYFDDALLIEESDGCVFLRKSDGRYLVYVDGAGLLGDRSFVFADKLDRNNPAFRWQLRRVDGTADKYRIASLAFSSEAYLAVENGNVYVQEMSSSAFPLDDYVFTLAYARVDGQDFAEGKEEQDMPFDFSKPFVMQFSSLKDQNLYLGISDGMSFGQANLTNYLSERNQYSKYAPLSMTGKSVFMFEPANDYSADSVYNPDGAELFRIRTYDGRYLGITKGNYLTGASDNDYVSATEFNATDFSQIWSVITLGDGVVRIQNMSYNYDWDIVGRFGELSVYLANLNAANNQTGMAVYQADYASYFDILLTNVDVEMQAVFEENLDGKTSSVSYLGQPSRQLTLGTNNVLQVAENSNSEFTFEKVEGEAEKGLYRIRTADGKYLTFDAWFQISAQEKQDGSQAQMFVLLPVCGIRGGYMICPYATGKTTDPVDGQNKYNCLFVNDEYINHQQLSGDDFMRVYNEYCRVEHRNYFQRIWIFDNV